jgi:Gram-negative bacterial TonB protein C-terminal
MKRTCWIIFSFFLYSALAAQSDTIKKFPNGNILLRKTTGTHLLSPSGQHLGSWKEILQNIKKQEKSLSIVRTTDSAGKKRTGIFDQLNGVFVLPMEYEQLIQADYTKGIFETRIGKKYGYFNINNGNAIPAVFDFARKHLNSNWYIVCVSGARNCGYVYNDQFQLLDSFPGMKSVRNRIVSGNREWLHINMADCQGLLDKDNKLVYRKEWQHIHDVKGMTAIVNNGKGIGLFNLETGKLLKPYSFTEYWPDLFGSQGFLQKGNHWALIDHLGKELFSFTADDVEFSQRGETGGFYFKQKGLWGVMNNKGKVVRTPVWESVDRRNVGGFSGNYKGKPGLYYTGVYKFINGEKVLTGIRQLTPDEVTAAYPDQAMVIQDEPKALVEMTNLPDAPGPSREEEENKIYIKMEVDPRFTSSEENEKKELRQQVDTYKKEHKIKKTGTVVVKLVVEKDGKISSTVIVSSADPLLTEAAKNLLSTITNWRPGIQNGRNVRGEKTLVFEW